MSIWKQLARRAVEIVTFRKARSRRLLAAASGSSGLPALPRTQPHTYTALRSAKIAKSS